MKNKYTKELQELKPWDEVQFIYRTFKEYSKIYTAGHGYLVVPVEDKNAELAKNIVKYGFTGKLAYYLEEDCELGEFLEQI